MSDNYPPLLSPKRIEIINKIESKKCAFDLLTQLLEKDKKTTKNEIFDALITREKLGSTYAGNGVAIPRAHMDVENPVAALLIIKNGLASETVDKKPIKIFLGFIIPEEQRKQYSKFIKNLNLILTNDEHRKFFIKSENPEQIAIYFESLLREIKNEEKNKDKEKETIKETNEITKTDE